LTLFYSIDPGPVCCIGLVGNSGIALRLTPVYGLILRETGSNQQQQKTREGLTVNPDTVLNIRVTVLTLSGMFTFPRFFASLACQVSQLAHDF